MFIHMNVCSIDRYIYGMCLSFIYKGFGVRKNHCKSIYTGTVYIDIGRKERERTKNPTRAKPKNAKLAKPIEVFMMRERKVNGQYAKTIKCTTKIQLRNALEEAKRRRPEWDSFTVRRCGDNTYTVMRSNVIAWECRDRFGFHDGTPECEN